MRRSKNNFPIDNLLPSNLLPILGNICIFKAFLISLVMVFTFIYLNTLVDVLQQSQEW